MAGIGFFLTKSSVQFTDTDVGISTMIVGDPFQLLLRVRVRMRPLGLVGARDKGFPGSVEEFVPAHQRGF